jgi:hypothetical protein
MPIQSKQINKIQAGVIRIAGLAVTGGTFNITTALSTALSTAGAGGISVPVQPSVNEGLGLITTGLTNRVEINDGTLAAAGNEIYSRLTEAGGVYTLTFFTLVNGVETAHSFASATTIYVDVPYRFDFWRLPTDSPIATSYRIIGGASGTAQAILQTEPLAVTATNTLANLSKVPNVPANLTLSVFGVLHYTIAPADFTVNGQAITWNPANAGFSLAVGDRVIAQYTTLG